MKYETTDYLDVELRSDRVLVITLNAPERLNAMAPEDNNELRRVLNQFEHDRDANAAVITGAGKAFCAGGFVHRLDGADALPPIEDMLRTWSVGTSEMVAFLNLTKPLVSAINGVAVGQGLKYALLSDISIASDRARLIDGHRRLGVTAGDHAALVWPLLCGLAKAKYYLMSGKEISGQEAERIGLVSMCVPHDELMTTALEVAADLAAGPQWAIRGTKRTLQHWLQMAQPIFEHSVALEMMNFLHADATEGIASFQEKRAPSYPSARGGY